MNSLHVNLIKTIILRQKEHDNDLLIKAKSKQNKSFFFPHHYLVLDSTVNFHLQSGP